MMKLVSNVHKAFVLKESNKLSASIELNRNAIADFFGIHEQSNEMDDFVDIVDHRLTEYLRCKETVQLHTKRFVSTIRQFIIDRRMPRSLCTNTRLNEFSITVINEIIEYSNGYRQAA
ncbi:hypothetical protein OAP63_13105 [Vibrio sp.]|nr:hypothetical protein [Vibrio sp.]